MNHQPSSTIINHHCITINHHENHHELPFDHPTLWSARFFDEDSTVPSHASRQTIDIAHDMTREG